MLHCGYLLNDENSINGYFVKKVPSNYSATGKFRDCE
jgi:hypothetical protein